MKSKTLLDRMQHLDVYTRLDRDKLQSAKDKVIDKTSSKKLAASALARGVLISSSLGVLMNTQWFPKDENGKTTGMTKFNLEKFISGYSYKYAQTYDHLFSFWANIIVSLLLAVYIFTKKKIPERAAAVTLKNIHSVSDMDDIISRLGTTEMFRETLLDFMEELSSYDSEILDAYLNSPNDIRNQELALAIIRGQLMANPNILDKLFRTFPPETIPDEIRQAYEKYRNSNDISWDCAVAQYNRANKRD